MVTAGPSTSQALVLKGSTRRVLSLGCVAANTSPANGCVNTATWAQEQISLHPMENKQTNKKSNKKQTKQ